MSWTSNHFSIISHLIPAQKKILADIVIFVAELPLGSCLNSSLQAQMKITVLIARLIWSGFFGLTCWSQSPSFQKNFLECRRCLN
ncbi:MAG: hypothetical protein CM1200mP30_12890 [Pseudomonadota bacterium]|nr:MAG: hypothetical protein CM1200mP30_12890 [Pseudomonadota bacterium]